MRISDWSSDVCSSDLVEGLVENRGGSPDERKGDDPESDDQELTVTAEGRAELRRLLSANVRPQVSDLNKLVIALKMRFLHLMEPADQRVQAELLNDLCARELARPPPLRPSPRPGPGPTRKAPGGA